MDELHAPRKDPIRVVVERCDVVAVVELHHIKIPPLSLSRRIRTLAGFTTWSCGLWKTSTGWVTLPSSAWVSAHSRGRVAAALTGVRA